MHIAILGMGYVGIVTAICLSEQGHQVSCYDIDKKRIQHYQKGICPFFEPEINDWLVSNSDRLTFSSNMAEVTCNAQVLFFCVGTPQKGSGEANLDFLKSAIEQSLSYVQRGTVMAIKSTVPPGTTCAMEKHARETSPSNKALHFAMVPEFLSQGTALQNGRTPTRIVIGTSDARAKQVLRELFSGQQCRIICTDPTSAEIAKYASNSFLATKVSFINEMSRLCEATGGNVEDVARVMGEDPRIGKEFLCAGIGYGGSCFPKDTRSLSFFAAEHGQHLPIVDAGIKSNEQQLARLLNHAREAFGSFSGLEVAVLGLAFKANTGDMRYSPALLYIGTLCKEGALVRGFDPHASYSSSLPGYREFDSPQEALVDADCCFILTNDDAIVTLGLAGIAGLMKQPYIFDGRNCFGLDEARTVACDYISVGRDAIHINHFPKQV